MKDGDKKILLKLHISILLAGLTGVFGKLISLNEGILVWYRLMLTTLLLFLYLVIIKKFPRISFSDFKRIGLLGALLSLHWVFFFGSIKASNVSVGVVCFSTIGIFTAIFEPLLLKRKFQPRELLYSLVTLSGVVLIFSFDTHYRFGIVLGVIGAALASLFTIATKRISHDYAPRAILFYEMLAGFIVLSLLVPFYMPKSGVGSLIPNIQDWVMLLIFVVFCTIVLQLFQIEVLKKLSAFTVNLNFNLEPVYSILIAMFFLGEAKELTITFYIGVSLIIISILLQTFASSKSPQIEVDK